MGRQARGVKAMKLAEDDQIVGMCVAHDDDMILTVSEKGYGRISKATDYRVQSRGGKGLTNYHTEKYGKVAVLQSVNLDDDIIMISQSGIVIRIETSSVRICNRPSKGVTLMRIGEDDKVVTIATTPHENEEEVEKVDNEESTENLETTDTVENNENTENTEE